MLASANKAPAAIGEKIVAMEFTRGSMAFARVWCCLGSISEIDAVNAGNWNDPNAPVTAAAT